MEARNQIITGDQFFGNRKPQLRKKGPGYFGPLKRPDNDMSTELSVGFNDPEFGGKETEVPLLVPTLTREEINYLLSGKEATPEILNKAKEHALLRIRSNKDPFAQAGEQGQLPQETKQNNILTGDEFFGKKKEIITGDEFGIAAKSLMTQYPPEVKGPTAREKREKRAAEWGTQLIVGAAKAIVQPGEFAKEQLAPIPESFAQAGKTILSNVTGWSADRYRMFDSYADKLSKITGIKKPELLTKLTENADYWSGRFEKEGITNPMIKDVVGAFTRAPADIAEIATLGKFGMPIVGAVHGGQQGIPEAIVGGVSGGLLGTALHGVSQLPIKQRVPSMAYLFGATTPGGMKEKLTSAITGAGLAIPGGKGQQLTRREISESWGMESPYQKYINQFGSIKYLSDHAKELGIPIEPGKDPYTQIQRWLGEGVRAESFIKDGTFKYDPQTGASVPNGEPLKKILDDYHQQNQVGNFNLKKKDLADYLNATRTIEDLQRPKTPGGEENIVTPEQVATAQAKLNELTQRHGNLGVFTNVADRIYSYSDRLLQYLVDGGRISEDAATAIKTANPHYIPWERVFEDFEQGPSGIPTRTGIFNRLSQPIKRIMGSQREIHDPIETLIKKTYNIIDVADRNRITNSVADFAQYYPDAIQQIPVPKQGTPMNNTILYYKNGEPQYLKTTPNIAIAMNGMTNQSVGPIMKIFGGLTRALKFGATTNLEFIFGNLARDQFTAATLNKFGYRPFVDIPATLMDIIGKSDVYKEFQRSGAAYSGFVGLDRDSLKSMYNGLLKKPSALKYLNVIGDLHKLSELVEQSTRLAAYKTVRGKQPGLATEPEAMKAGRGATVDFRIGGTDTKDIEAIIPFFRAGIQGVNKMFSSFADDPSGTMFRGIAMITVPSIIEYALMKDDPEYKELAQWDKNMFWHFRLGGRMFRIIRPFIEGQLFGAVPQRFLEWAETKDPEIMPKLMSTLWQSVSPVSGDFATGLIPQAIKPVVENIADYNFFRGRRLEGEVLRRLPAEERARPYTTETAKALGKITGPLTGTSPIQLENLVSGYLGGLGRYGLEASDLAIKGVRKVLGKKEPEEGKRPFDISSLPIIRRFTERPLYERTSESVERFYDNMKKSVEWQASFSDAVKSNNTNKIAEILNKHPEVKYGPLFTAAADQLQEIRKLIDEINKKPIPDKSKKQIMNQLTWKMINISQRMNEMVKQK